MKAILVMDMPSSCLERPIGKDMSMPIETCIKCPFGKCVIDEETRTRPNWCPLKPAPQKQPTEMKTINDDINKLVFNEGYNACIDEILGDKE